MVRCFRLKVECNPSPTVRRSGSRPNGSQAARLEQKLDGLVSLLKARQGSLEPEETASSSGSFISAPSHASVPADRGSNAQPLVGDLDKVATDQGNKYSANTSQSWGQFPHSHSEGLDPSSGDAKQHFKAFFSHYTEFLPLLYLENGSTSEKLYRESPFLWLCIMAVTSTDAKEQSSLAKTVREVAARENTANSKPSVATFQTVGESLVWSPFLEECLKMIQCSRCVRGDELLVQMIKLQRITSKVTDVRIQLRDTDSEQSTRLIYPYIFSLNTQLSEMRKQLPPHLTTNTKRAVDIMFNFNPTEYTYFPFFLWRQFRTVILTLIRLASFEDPAWDVNMVRRTVDITSILDKTAENLSNVQTNVDDGITDHENVVSKSLAWVKRMRSCLLAIYGQSTDAQASISEFQSSMGIPGVETLLPRQSSQEEASPLDIFSSLDNDLFGDDIFEWWSPLYSGNGP
ncbi:hypothetical protein BO83DRAFT_400818 [Aspergillus eucalypticola CBS 122712]|uniref:C6 transcription factor n=1 Tax=Aspergillus eucalypticola (strain CBS 122712 / IBT 29274) TaxID=1448314 RepID=A0A317V611_ASPEC|nr:uncharacterized protein BO83DRAFT_400818 [Aspergillus eucalypticola CBS 122712]PWY68367.1 hypothetical protein BO83DRAFT_400818 [Aspergillus eucalypticola CBS 122712]